MSRYEEVLKEYRALPDELQDSINNLTEIALYRSGQSPAQMIHARVRVRLADLHPHQADALSWLNAFIAAVEGDNLEKARQERDKALAVIDLYRVSQINLRSLVVQLKQIEGGSSL